MYIIVALTLIGSFLLWFISRELSLMYPEVSYLQYPLLFGLYATIIAFIYCLYAGYQLLMTTDVSDRLLYIRHMQYCAVAIGALYVAGMFVLITVDAMQVVLFWFGLLAIVVSMLVYFTGYHMRYQHKKRGLLS